MSGPGSRSAPERLRVFAYLDAEKAGLYRRVMRAFIQARDGFRLHLRPAELREALSREELGADASIPLEIEPALGQLCEWGNLVRHPDTTEVGTVEEFYRPRFLYQLTVSGEAAERAVHRFEEELRKPGELQTAALHDIRSHLAELAVLAGAQPVDDAKVANVFAILRDRFHSLTDRAQAFMASLQRGIDLHGLELDQFLRYKERLIEYLDRFIGELVVATTEIAEWVARIEATGVDRLLSAAARRDLVDLFNPSEEEVAEIHLAWRRRWDGLKGWFVAEGGRRAQADVLRASARSAIIQFLAALGGINDRRVTRSDRAQDFRTLARWFAQCPGDSSAHALYRTAFGLAPSRHLAIDPASLDAREQAPVASSVSWLQAPPLLLSPRLRATGKHTRSGRANSVIDRSQAKERLARLAAEQQARLAEAEARFATGTPFRLSSLGPLRAAELDLLLDLLGDALTQRLGPELEIEATSADGTLLVRLEPPALPGDVACLESEEGTLRAPDFRITVRRPLASASPEPAGRTG